MPPTTPLTELAPGIAIESRELRNLQDQPVPVPDGSATVHLQFRRFAGCPICSVHLRPFTARHAELVAAGIREVVVFHSTTTELLRYRSELPFDVIADPDRALYDAFGVGRGIRAVLGPRAALTGVRGLLGGESLRGTLKTSEDHLGRPADFLISSEGVVRAAEYGTNADDGWTLDQVLELAGTP